MWICVDERLPPLDQRVEVKGDYVPEGTGYPVSYRRGQKSRPAALIAGGYCAARADWRWESTEWRGTVAVRYWREMQT